MVILKKQSKRKGDLSILMSFSTTHQWYKLGFQYSKHTLTEIWSALKQLRQLSCADKIVIQSCWNLSSARHWNNVLSVCTNWREITSTSWTAKIASSSSLLTLRGFEAGIIYIISFKDFTLRDYRLENLNLAISSSNSLGGSLEIQNQ